MPKVPKLLIIIIGILLFIGVLFLVTVLIDYYLTIENDYYSSYSDIDPARFESDYFPTKMPESAFDIHKQTDWDMGATWIRFQVSNDDKKKMIEGLRKLTQQEIDPDILFSPERDVDWWFDNLRQIEPEDVNNLDADVFAEKGGGIFDSCYFAVDKDSLYVYYWCS
jgi:hypothetical protein